MDEHPYWNDILWAELARPRFVPMLEAYRGTEVVGWYGRIERQLTDLVNQFQSSRDYDSKAKAQTYLDIWRQNELTGSINVEQLNALLGPASVLAVDNWGQANYFAQLRDQLRKLKANQEELPPMGAEDGPPPTAKRMGGGAPVVNPEDSGQPEPEQGEPDQDFGPQPEPGEHVDNEGKPEDNDLR